MKVTGNRIGLLVLLGIALYVYSVWRQTTGIEAVCAAYPVGTTISDPAAAADAHGVKLMGSGVGTQKAGTRRFIFCATLTMCDVSCSLEVDGARVTRSTFSSL